MTLLSRRSLFAAPLLFAACPAIAAEEKKKEMDFVNLGDFTINLPSAPNTRRRHFVIVSVTVETTPASSPVVRDVTPRLKEAVMRRLMSMSERGMLRPTETDPLIVKDSLLEALVKVPAPVPMREALRDVVITRIVHS